MKTISKREFEAASLASVCTACVHVCVLVCARVRVSIRLGGVKVLLVKVGMMPLGLLFLLYFN